MQDSSRREVSSWYRWLQSCLVDDGSFRFRDRHGNWHRSRVLFEESLAWEKKLSTHLPPQSRVVLYHGEDFPFISCLFGALMAGLKVCPKENPEDLEDVIDGLRPAAILDPVQRNPVEYLKTTEDGKDLLVPEDVDLLLQSSESLGPLQWRGITFHNIRANLDGHRVLYDRPGPFRMLSGSPWSHAFGLVLDLFLAIECGVSLIRIQKSLHRTRDRIDFCRHLSINGVVCYPQFIDEIKNEKAGHDWLKTCRTGLVGSGPIRPQIAEVLKGTGFRAAYGLTAASPGILLTKAGEIEPHILGRPVGCEVRTTEEGILQFRGPNLCPGNLLDGEWQPAEEDWFTTVDVVEEKEGCYFYRGRRDALIRLQHGTSISASELENRFRLQYLGLEHIWIHSVDGKTLVVVYTGEDYAPRRIEDQLVTWLPYRFPVEVVAVPVPTDFWILNQKGGIDRTGLLSRIKRASDS